MEQHAHNTVHGKQSRSAAILEQSIDHYLDDASLQAEHFFDAFAGSGQFIGFGTSIDPPTTNQLP